MANLKKAEADASAINTAYEFDNYKETKSGIPVKQPQQGLTKPKRKRKAK